ncbi:hypothetical protein IMSAGC006_02102 [Muribaculaceae bacterium]|jgi:hypothetical protein|nr:hypothetical protein IMSAGC006_02102 [Muribaculaceae bacterium]
MCNNFSDYGWEVDHAKCLKYTYSINMKSDAIGRNGVA